MADGSTSVQSAEVDPAIVITSLAYKQGWTFKLGGPGHRSLCIFATTPDSNAPDRLRTTQHMFEIPDGLDERALIRWIFQRVVDAEHHEAGEFFAVNGHRPFFPHHQDEGSPYLFVESWPDLTKESRHGSVPLG